MATTRETVQVKFEADTKQYNKAVGTSKKATTALTDSVGDFGLAAKQTTEGAIDSLTGTSGLGAAFTAVGGRIKDAARSMSTFTKALIATGAGVAIAAIAFVASNWDSIAVSIGLATENLEKFNEESKSDRDEANDAIERKLVLLRLTGATEKEISERNRELLENEQIAQEKNLANASEAIAARKEVIRQIGNQSGALGIARKATEEEDEALIELNKGFEKTSEELEIINARLALFDSNLTSEAAPALERMSTEFDTLNPKLEDFAELLERVSREKDSLFVPDIDEEELDASVAKVVDANRKSIAQREKDLADSNKRQEVSDLILFDSKVNAAFAFADLGIVLAEENQELQGGIMVAQAVANGALGITSALSLPPPAIPFAIAAVVATTAAQIAVITQQLGGGGGSAPTASFTPTREDTPVETAFNVNQQQQFVPVLVTEDLTAVTNRVAVTEARASLG